jgi:hypothetical protein
MNYYERLEQIREKMRAMIDDLHRLGKEIQEHQVKLRREDFERWQASPEDASDRLPEIF